jgi:hypothetical protein
MKKRIIENLRLRTAELSVSPSTVRRAGARGVLAASRRALKSTRLARFRVHSQRAFAEQLNRETIRIMRRLPDGARRWGIARKVLNIFLRSVVFNRHLCAAYSLAHLEPWLELPLDRQVAEGIWQSSPSLPRWEAIRGLSPGVSAQYQAAARLIALQHRVPPIQLEYLWWRA